MSLADLLTKGRAAVEALMTDTCRITRPGSGDPVFNKGTGQYDDPAPVTVYEGKCRIPSVNTTTGKNGGAVQSFAVGEFPLDLPLDGPGYTTGETVAPGQTITYLTAPYNAALVGMVFGVTEPLLASHQTKQRWKIKTAVAQ